MNALARGLILLAVAAYVGLSGVDAYAGSSGSTGGSAGAAGAAGAAGGGGDGRTQFAQSTPGPGNGDGGHGYGGNGGAGISLPNFDAPAPASGACAAGLELPDPSSYANAIDGLQDLSKKTQEFIERCDCKTQACVADALDKYADAVAKLAPRLPPTLRKLPAIIHAAANKARVAPTPRAAVKVLIAAIATVHKTIALLRASDPDAKAEATRGGEAVAETLKTAATALARADSL